MANTIPRRAGLSGAQKAQDNLGPTHQPYDAGRASQKKYGHYNDRDSGGDDVADDRFRNGHPERSQASPERMRP